MEKLSQSTLWEDGTETTMARKNEKSRVSRTPQLVSGKGGSRKALKIVLDLEAATVAERLRARKMLTWSRVKEEVDKQALEKLQRRDHRGGRLRAQTARTSFTTDATATMWWGNLHGNKTNRLLGGKTESKEFSCPVALLAPALPHAEHASEPSPAANCACGINFLV
jgi:hypothetical protein